MTSANIGRSILRAISWAVLLMACGSSGGEPAASAAPPATPVPPALPAGLTVTEAQPPDAAEFFVRVRAILGEGTADYQQRCCDTSDRGRMPEHVVDPALSGDETHLVGAVQTGRILYWPTVAAACLTVLRQSVPAVSADCSGPWAHGRPLPELEDIDVCHGVLVGTVAATEPCTADRECADGYCTALAQPNGSSIEGCRAFPAAGEACGGLGGAQCRHPLECIDGHCAARVAAGAGCAASEYWACAVGNYCSVPTGADRGTCAARLPNGATCTESRTCASEVCDGGVCVPICDGPDADILLLGPIGGLGEASGS